LLKGLRARGEQMFINAMEANIVAIGQLLAGSPGAVMLDVGCDDGVRSLRFAEAAQASEVHGVEIVPEAAALATERGLIVKSFDLCEPWPYPDDFFDVICSNQVIEHLRDTDTFVRETKRCLKPGGTTVVSTENLASWHNVGSLFFGWQPFSLTNVSETVGGLGNPFALHHGLEPDIGTTWQHLRVFAYAGLRDLYNQHGLVVHDIIGSGYYPLPGAIARLDPRHAAFLALAARKN
jgi:SAM-dependent methyltransferase